MFCIRLRPSETADRVGQYHSDFSQSCGTGQVCERAVKINQPASPGGERIKKERKETISYEIYKIWSHEWDLNIKSAQPVIPSI